MVRGTRILTGAEAKEYRATVTKLRSILLEQNYEEVVVSALARQDTFIKRAGPEIVKQIYAFDDHEGHSICVIPEVTAVLEEMWKEEWSKTKPHPYKIFYVSRCYRYEQNPTDGRYREFTQFGVEILGGNPIQSKLEINAIMARCIHAFKFNYQVVPAIKRGLTYYTKDGFEIECPDLGAQQQVLGGGEYESGVGFGIGVERLILAVKSYKGGTNVA